MVITAGHPTEAGTGGPADRCHTPRDQPLQFRPAERRHAFARR